MELGFEFRQTCSDACVYIALTTGVTLCFCSLLCGIRHWMCVNRNGQKEGKWPLLLPHLCPSSKLEPLGPCCSVPDCYILILLGMWLSSLLRQPWNFAYFSPLVEHSTPFGWILPVFLAHLPIAYCCHRNITRNLSFSSYCLSHILTLLF